MAIEFDWEECTNTKEGFDYVHAERSMNADVPGKLERVGMFEDKLVIKLTDSKEAGFLIIGEVWGAETRELLMNLRMATMGSLNLRFFDPVTGEIDTR